MDKLVVSSRDAQAIIGWGSVQHIIIHSTTVYCMCLSCSHSTGQRRIWEQLCRAQKVSQTVQCAFKASTYQYFIYMISL